MKEIKAYKPSTNSISEGQVLSCPYPYDKAKIIVMEMADSLVLQLTDKGLVTDSLTLDVGYDWENCDSGKYRGPMHIDHYGRTVPKGAHGSTKLDNPTNLGSILISATTELFEKIADKTLTATIHNAERLTANLDVTTRQLNSLMNNELPQITGRLVTITDNFSVISENLKGIDYASTFSKVDSTLYNVQLLTEKLTRKDNTIGLLFNDPTFYQNLSTTTANAASLLEDLKAHPKRYVHFSLFGKKDK